MRTNIPNSVVDDIWRAVESAVESRVSVGDFLTEVRSCWQEAIRRQGEAAEYEFKTRLK